MDLSEFSEGWKVVVATFFVCFLTDGFVFQFGLFLVELLDEFESSRATTAFIGSIGLGIFYVLGPVTGALSDTYGCRRLAIAGTLISFAGFLSASFARTIPIMYITYGLFGGFGFSVLWVPANACVMKHFTKRRALASGIAVCGTGFGTFAFSKLVSYLISEYGWRMALFIMSAVVLNGVPCGLLLVRKKMPNVSIKNESIQEYNEEDFTNYTTTESTQNDTIKTDNEHMCTNRKERVYEVETNVNSPHEKEQSFMNHTTTESTRKDTIQQENGHMSANRKEKVFELLKNEHIAQENEESLTNRKERFHAHHMTMESSQKKLTHQGNENRLTNREEWIKNILKSILHATRNVFEENRHLMKNKRCVFFMISTFFVGLGFSVPYSILPDHAAQLGMSKSDASWLVSSIGVSTTFGRILFGWLGDKFAKYRRVMFEAMILVQGLSIAAIPVMKTFETKLIPTSSFALAYGCYFTSLAVVLADEFGQDEIGKTLGLNFFSLGLSTLVAAPLAGGIYDVSHSYSMSFYVAGGNLCLGTLWLLIPRKIFAFRERQNNTKSLPHTHSTSVLIELANT